MFYYIDFSITNVNTTMLIYSSDFIIYLCLKEVEQARNQLTVLTCMVQNDKIIYMVQLLLHTSEFKFIVDNHLWFAFRKDVCIL